MPLINIHLIRGRSPEQVRALLDATHDAMVQAFDVPTTDRYQIVTQHAPEEVIALDTGLGMPRTENIVVVEVTSRQRSPAAKETFYRLMSQHLKERCGVEPTDVIISVVENHDADWSFGGGSAQFLTGAL